MDYIESIFLGIVQGLTEFLPISSSGHIEIAKVFFQNNYSSEENLTFTIILHFQMKLVIYYLFNALNALKNILTAALMIVKRFICFQLRSRKKSEKEKKIAIKFLKKDDQKL